MIALILSLACLTAPSEVDTADTADTGDLAPALIVRVGIDLDGDGYRSAVDCNDRNPATYPGAPERCDGADNDCDGLIDMADPDFPLSEARTAYRDADGDGLGAQGVGYCGAMPSGYVLVDGDCDDTNPDLPIMYHWDGDGDGCGWLDPLAPVVLSCDGAPEGYADNTDDCDDADADTCGC